MTAGELAEYFADSGDKAAIALQYMTDSGAVSVSEGHYALVAGPDR